MAEVLNKRTSKYFLGFIAIAVSIYILYLLSIVVILFALSVLLGFIFAPFVRVLEGKGLSRTFSTSIVFLTFGFLVYLALSSVIPKLVLQMDELIAALKDFSLNEELNIIEKKILAVFPF